MILKFREPVYNYRTDPDCPDGPKLRGDVRTHFFQIFGEVSEVQFIDECVRESEICPAPDSGKPASHVDRWIRDRAKEDNNDERGPLFKLVHFETPTGRKTVAFNTTAFLCNDKGDTVDKIVV